MSLNETDQPKLQLLKNLATASIAIGWALVLWAGWSIAQWPGVALAAGFPLMVWGWWIARLVFDIETQ